MTMDDTVREGVRTGILSRVTSAADQPAPPERRGRYLFAAQLAVGGMARVHLGRLIGPAGFSRVVAIKRLHAYVAGDPAFVAMLLDEARLAGRIRHPNVVPTLDVAREDGEFLLVMEYVHGAALSELSRASAAAEALIPPSIASSILGGALLGLHAAHQATDGHGRPLDVVHRDVSPQNILVGVDGVTKVVDFGIAKAASRLQATRDGEL